MAKKNTVEETVVENTEVEAAVKPEKAVVEIVRGRMPLPIVAMIKFAPTDATDGSLAAKFRTTNGKVSDIRKERNFGYVKSDYVPSQEQIDKAKAYAAQLSDASILETLNGITAATDEQTKAFEEARGLVRKNAAPKSSAKQEEVKVETAEVSDDALAGLTE